MSQLTDEEMGGLLATIFVLLCLAVYVGLVYNQQCISERVPLYVPVGPEMSGVCLWESAGVFLLVFGGGMIALYLMSKIAKARQKRWLRMRLTRPSIADMCYYICMADSEEQMQKICDLNDYFIEQDEKEREQ